MLTSFRNIFVMKNKYWFTCLGVLCLYVQVSAQLQHEPLLVNGDTIRNYSLFNRKLVFAGVLQTRYVASLTSNVDVNGKQYNPAITKGIDNSFLMKRVRLMVKADINDHFSANVLANFAEFNGDPSNKVLENAYIKYSLNQYFHIQAGQFRPFFGIEDAVSVDIIRTLDFSNQYYAFGKNGWQSFQIGVTLLGDMTKNGKFRYFAGVYNGNNKNQSTDDNNTKNFYVRLEADPTKDFTIGMNAGSGSLATSTTGNAYGADATGKISFSTRWKLLISGEYKSGSNFLAYNVTTQLPKPGLSQYRMQGFYFFPTLIYEYKRPRVRAIEFSSRYEYFDENHLVNSNARQTIIPNVSLIFADDFYAALQLGVSIDLYKNNIPLTTSYSNSLAYVQLQIRF